MTLFLLVKCYARVTSRLGGEIFVIRRRYRGRQAVSYFGEVGQPLRQVTSQRSRLIAPAIDSRLHARRIQTSFAAKAKNILQRYNRETSHRTLR